MAYYMYIYIYDALLQPKFNLNKLPNMCWTRFVWWGEGKHAHIHTHTYIYIYISTDT